MILLDVYMTGDDLLEECAALLCWQKLEPGDEGFENMSEDLTRFMLDVSHCYLFVWIYGFEFICQHDGIMLIRTTFIKNK